MSIARRLERRIEGLLDDMAGKLARGPLQPIELAGRLVREADLASVDGEAGRVVPNHFRVEVNPADVPDGLPLPELTEAVAEAVDESFAERGWRADGPVVIDLRLEPATGRGTVDCAADRLPGALPAWAELRGKAVYPIRHNRAIVGRSADADVVIPDDSVSRRHALVWRQSGTTRIRDLGSSNGTSVEGLRLGDSSADLPPGAVVTLGGVTVRFDLVGRAGV